MKITGSRLAAALLASTAVCVGAVEIDANRAARAELRRFLDRHSGATVGSIFAEPLTGRLTLRDVAVGSGSTRLTIGRLELPLPRGGFGFVGAAVASPFDDKPEQAAPEQPVPEQAAPEPAAPAQPAPEAAAPPAASSNGSATAENVTIKSGDTTFHIKRIDATGTPLSSADLTALVDPNATEPLEARLKKLTATSISVPEILADGSTGGMERHATISQLVFSGVTAGKIAATSVGSASFAIKDGDDNSNGGIGSIQVSALDLPQIVHVVETARTDESETPLPLYDSITMTDIKVNDLTKKSDFSLSTLKEAGVKARALKDETRAGMKDDAPKRTDEQKASDYEDFIHAFEVGAIEATGLQGQGGTSPGSFTLASMSLKDVGNGKVGGFALRAFRFDGPQAKFAIGSVDVGPLTMPPPPTAHTTANGASMPFPSSAQADISQIDFDGTSDSDKGAPPSRVAFKIAHIGFASEGDAGDLPKSSKTKIDNMTFDVPAGTGQTQPLYAMGYHHVDISLGAATVYDPAAQALMIRDLTLNGANMGSLALGLHLVNVTKGLVSANQEVAKASALAILVKGFTLDLINDGFVERVLTWRATQDGITVAQERQGLIDFVQTKVPPPLNQNANVKLVSSAVAKFIADPKNLHVGVESKSGLGMGSIGLLADPNTLIDALDVKAAANQ